MPNEVILRAALSFSAFVVQIFRTTKALRLKDLQRVTSKQDNFNG